METIVEIKKDPPKEMAESNWSAKTGYELVAEDIRTQYSLFRWSRLLKSWFNYIPIFERGVRKDIVALERVNVVDCVCHGQEDASEKQFYMYMCHFSQLYVRLSFDDFTVGVLRLLNIALTQLHSNSWAYRQAFRVLCQCLYLQPSPQSFLYFYDTRPKSPKTWLSLISQSGISTLDAFTQSFKHFKDGFFKVVMKEPGRSYFYTNDGDTKFLFSWTDNLWHYKDMKREKLSLADREMVDTLMKFNDKMPTKGLVRIYNSIHLIVDI